MPAWIHERAKHIRAKNPDMKESTSFAIATQQSHALGKSPKSYGTAEGRATAKEKYKTPGDDKKTAAMTKMAAFSEELEKLAKEKDSGFFDAAKNLLTTPISGTPELFGGMKAGIEKATRGGMPGKGPSAGFQKFQQQRAAGMNPKVAFATNAFSGPMNPGFPTGASMMPPFKKPSPTAGPLGKTASFEEEAAEAVKKIASGEPTRGGFLLASHIPPFRPPPMVKLDSFAEYYPYNPGDFKPAQLNKKAMASPAAILASSKRIGTAPGSLGHRGPSVEQVSKPKGFGKPEAGTLKAGLI